MARVKFKIDGYYKVIKDNTEYEIIGNNILFTTLDRKNNYINYIINKNLFIKYIDLISDDILNQDLVNIEKIEQKLYEPIFEVYKTKVAIKRISQIILNIFVYFDYAYSDDGENYEIRIKNSEFIDDLMKSMELTQ